eukprot:4776618-Amphidinium_carterae.1
MRTHTSFDSPFPKKNCSHMFSGSRSHEKWLLMARDPLPLGWRGLFLKNLRSILERAASIVAVPAPCCSGWPAKLRTGLA